MGPSARLTVRARSTTAGRARWQPVNCPSRRTRRGRTWRRSPASSACFPAPTARCVADVDWAAVAGLIVAGVVTLLLLATAMWLCSSSQPSPAAAALAPATVTAKTLPRADLGVYLGVFSGQKGNAPAAPLLLLCLLFCRSCCSAASSVKRRAASLVEQLRRRVHVLPWRGPRALAPRPREQARHERHRRGSRRAARTRRLPRVGRPRRHPRLPRLTTESCCTEMALRPRLHAAATVPVESVGCGT
jgi:hypothetical protein